MTTWSTVVLTLGSALIGAIGALAGTYVHVRSSRVERLAKERQERRERGAAAVAEALTLLADLGRNVSSAASLRPEEATRLVADLESRWRRIQESLVAYTTVMASAEAAASAQQLLAVMWQEMETGTKALLYPEAEPSDAPYVGLKPFQDDAVSKAWELLGYIRKDDPSSE